MILDEIVRVRRADLAAAKRCAPLRALEEKPAYSAPRRDFFGRVRDGRPAVVAEIKKASPSRSVIRADFDPVAIAHAYEAAGAAAISVLTEERYFKGGLTDLSAVRGAVDLPLLRKDFVIDPYQVVEGRAWGADAVLLIAAVLDDVALGELLAAAAQCGLGALVEVHTEAELERVASAGAKMIGVNNRNLQTFETTLATAERLRPLVPEGAVPVAESGIRGADDVERLRKAGYEAFLIGETLMRAPDPGKKLKELVGGRSSC